jgi:predicted tellurium resistance membrane protein TerC
MLASGLDFTAMLSGDAIVALLALTAMEIVLGIDNIVFIAIVTGRLPPEKRSFARRLGLTLAMVMRIGLLLMISVLIGLTEPVIDLAKLIPLSWLAEHPEFSEISGRDLILLAGGLFLLHTAVSEIHHKIEGGETEAEIASLPNAKGPADAADTSLQQVSMAGVLARILFMDVIFSLDSVITAVGMTDHIPVMILAVVISVGVMIAFANQISDFVQAHPTVKMLALSFLMLIGVVLISDGIGTPISKGYIYFAMAFSLLVEFLNLRAKMKRYRPSRGEGETGLVRGPEPG